MWKSVTIGLSIGLVVSSPILYVFTFIGSDQIKMMLILYLYYVIGGLTGYLVYRYLTNIKIVGNPSPNNTQTEKSNLPQKLINTLEYKQTLDRISSLKKTSLILKELIETRKKFEGIKRENTSILEDSVEKIDSKSLDLIKEYLKTN